MAEIFSFEDANAGRLQVADRSKKREPIVVPPAAAVPNGSLLPSDAGIRNILEGAASKHGVPLPLLMAMAHQESTYRPDAIGPETKWGTAKGLMQYLDDTARRVGIDALDPMQAADAAAKQMAERLGKGIDWAVAAHHAGDNPRQHGPKTKKYTEEILAKAGAIAKELGIDFAMPQEPAVPTGPETFSFEDVMQEAPKQTPSTPPAASDDRDTFTPGAFIRELGNAAKRGWEGFQEILNRETQDIEISDQELRAEWENAKQSQSKFFGAGVPQDFESYKMLRGNRRTISANSYKDEELQWKQMLKDNPETVDMLPARFKHLRPQAESNGRGGFQQFIDTLRNPVELLTRESLPANFISWLANQPELERKKYDEARQVAMQQDIVANPDKYPKVSVEAAQAAIDARREKQEPTVRAAWDNLVEGVKANPAQFGGELVNALIADPYMLAAPIGIGAKPIQSARAAAGMTAQSRVAQIADRLLDAGGTSAAMNVAIGAVENMAATGEINAQEVKLNAAIGALIGGPIGAIFMRGARASAADVNAAKLNGTYDDILRDAAKAEVELEDIVAGRSNVDPNVRRRIEDMLGIRNSYDRANWQAKRESDIKAAFSKKGDPNDNIGQVEAALDDYDAYQSFKAEERMRRAQELAASGEQARLAREADAARLSAEARRDALQAEFDNAIAARNAMAVDDLHGQALIEDELFNVARKLNNDEYLDALFTGDDPTIKQTNARIKRRESQLRMPKWQRGEADPVLLARIGLATGAAGLAYAVTPEDYKVTNSVMAGLAGLFVPGASRASGSVLSKMRQSGMITPEGDIIGLMIKQGKLANKLEADDLKARDNTWVDQAVNGDQAAFKSLYDTYFNDTRRYVNKFMRELGEKAGLDAEDITQEAFLKAYHSLDKFSRDNPFGAWIKRIARNEALDAIDKMRTQKRGSEVKIVGEDIPGVRDSYSGDLGTGSSVYEKGAGSDIFDTPEQLAMADEAATRLSHAFEKLPAEMKEAVTMSQLQNFTDVEIADMLKVPLGTVQRRIQRGKELLTNAIKSEYSAAPIPKGQRGSADPATLKKVAIASAGATLGWYLSDDRPIWGMGVGTVAGLLAAGKVGASVVQGVDYGLGIVSTRVRNHSPVIHRAVVNMFRKTLEETHQNFQKVDPFLARLNQLPKDVQDVVHRAVMTGDPVVIKKLLDHLGDKQLIDGYKGVRSVLDSLGDRLESLSRFKRKDVKEYFPRIVKDKEGLFQAIDKKEATRIADILKQAEVESMRKRGRGLNQAEESALINQIMFVDKRSNQPGWSKDRRIEEITPELQKFYATPAESLHTYIRSAVEDIAKTEFFGKSAKNQVKKDQQFLDTEKSINNLIADEVKSGRLSDEAANEVSKLLKSVLVGGDQTPAWLVREAKNLSNAGLLGNFWSAATQLGDVVMQVYMQDMRATMDSIVRQATGRKFVDMREYGLADSITAEFATQSRTARLVNKLFKYSLFAGVDRFGKNTALNAAVSRAQRLAESPSGQVKLANRYAESFGEDFPKLVSDLKSGKVTPLTREYAFLELSRSQPVTKFEMPQWWLDSPNVGRSALVLKSFMLKQIDLARRDGINLIKEGKIAQGAMKLTELGIVLGLAGTASDVVKQVLSQGVSVLTGNNPKELNVDLSDVPLNMLRTFGLSEYTRDRIFGVSKEEAAERRAAGERGARTVKAEPSKAVVEYFTPPFRMWEEIIKGNPSMYRYIIPGFGPYVAEQLREADAEGRQAREKKGGSL